MDKFINLQFLLPNYGIPGFAYFLLFTYFRAMYYL